MGGYAAQTSTSNNLSEIMRRMYFATLEVVQSLETKQPQNPLQSFFQPQFLTLWRVSYRAYLSKKKKKDRCPVKFEFQIINEFKWAPYTLSGNPSSRPPKDPHIYLPQQGCGGERRRVGGEEGKWGKARLREREVERLREIAFRSGSPRWRQQPSSRRAWALPPSSAIGGVQRERRRQSE